MKASFIPGEISLWCLLVVCLSLSFPDSSWSETNRKIDSLENILTRSIPDTQRVIVLNKLSYQYMRVAFSDKALDAAKRAFELGHKIGYLRGQAKSLINTGNVFLMAPELDSARKAYASALAYATQMGDKRIMADCTNNLGEVFRLKGSLDQALFYYLESLKIEEGLADKAGIAETLNNIGLLYVQMGNHDKAIESYKRSIEISRELNDLYVLSVNLLNLADVYSESKKPEAALSCYEQSAAISKEIHNPETGGKALLGIGNVYVELNRLKEAMRYYEESLAIADSGRDKITVCSCLMNIGLIHEKNGAYEKAIGYEKRALALSLELGLKPEIRDCYYLLTRTYAKSGNAKQSLEYFNRYVQLNDSLRNKESSGQIAEMQTKYESEKKQKENEVLEQKNQLLSQQSRIQHLTIQQNRYSIWGLAILSLLVMAIAFLLVRQNRVNAQYAKIEMEQKLLRSQMNPHFIFNAMVGIQNYIYKEEPEVAANYLTSVVYLMRSIIENSTQEYVLLEKEILTIRHYMTLQQVRFPDKFKFSIIVDPGVDMESTLIPPMMAQPFIENAIVHGILNKPDGEGFVSVKFGLQGSLLSLEIVDNGVGREKARELGRKDNSHLSVATSITRERLAILNRKVKVKNVFTITDLYDEQQKASGTRVTFLFTEKYPV